MFARLKRLTVKLVLLSSALGIVGASAYHYRSHWLPESDVVSLTDAVQLEASDESVSNSTLSAVASAWADEANSHQANSMPHVSPTPSTQPIAFTNEVRRNAEPDDGLHASRSAYGGESTTPDPSTERYTATQSTVPGEDRYTMTTEASLARGQEPTDESAEDDELFSEALRSETPRSAASSPGAKAAFAADNNRQVQPSGDRYGAARDESEPTSTANPFAGRMGTGVPVLADKAEPIEDRDFSPEVDATARQQSDGIESSLDARRYDAIPPRQLRDDARSPGAAFDTAETARSVTVPTHAPIARDFRGSAGGTEPTNMVGSGRPGERALEGPQQPSLLVQKFAPSEIQVGKPAQFSLKIRNVGQLAAADVVVHDEVPHGTRLISTSPRCEAQGGLLTWQLGTLSPGEERLLEMQLMPTEEGQLGSVATVTFATQASAKSDCTMPKLAIRMTAPTRVMIGEEQRVKIELHNPGSGDATGVMLFENVPENLAHEAGKTLEFEVGDLAAGETRELELILLAERPGKVVNVVTAKAEGNLQVQQQVEFEVIAPDLRVDIDGPERRYLERPATYEVTVANPGTAAAKDIDLVTRLPKGMRFVRANNMGEYDSNTHAVYWSLAELPEGERGSVEFVAMPIESGEQMLEVEGKAGQGLTDETKRSVLVEGLAAINFEVSDLEDPIEVGRETTYEIRVVNQGTKAASNVEVLVGVPPSMQVVSATGETRHSVQAGGVAFEPLAQLPPKAEALYEVHVQGVRPGDQRVTVQVDTDDNREPIRKEESTRVFGDE